MTETRDVYEALWTRKLGDAGTAPSQIGRGSRGDVALRLLGNREGRWLDIGAGDGQLLRAGPDRADRIGVDISMAAARRAGVSMVCADLNRGYLPFAAETFDTVTCLDVIEHLIEPRQIVAEIARTLAPGGIAAVSTVNMRYLKRIAELAIRGRFPRTSQDDEPYDGGHIHYFAPGDLRRLLRATGLEIVSTTAVIPSRWTAFLRRWAGSWVVSEFLAPGIVVVARRPSAEPAG